MKGVMVSGILAASLLEAAAGSAQDWSQWRGPARDGRAQGVALPTTWPKALKQAWKVPVGAGHSSPVIAGERAFLISRDAESEVLAAYDLKTGQRQWELRYPAPYTMNPAATGHGKGPKATPVVAGGLVCAFGISGVLSCADAATGRLLWRKDFAGEFKSTSPAFGVATSPILVDGVLIVHVGGEGDGALRAFDARSGAARWSFKGDGPAYASVVVATLDGVRQAITQTQARVVGVEFATGALLWSIPFTTAYDQNSVTPLVVGDTVVFSGLGTPLRAVRPSRKDGAWRVDPVWDAPDLSLYMSSPVIAGKHLVGFTHKGKGRLFAVDAKTGKLAWTSEPRLGENAALVAAGGVVMALIDDAKLIVFDPAADTYVPLATYTVAESPTWAHPAPTRAGFLVKDASTLALWQVP
jgi:outer membrane protein assembly factor BamB